MSIILVNPYIYNYYDFLAPATSSVMEGQTVTYTIRTNTFGTGTLYWTLRAITGTISNSTFSSPANAVTSGGSVSIVNNSGSFTLTLGISGSVVNKSYVVDLRLDSTSGPIVTTSNTISILTFGGEAIYDTPGTYYWTAPAGVTQVCAVAIGGGGGGGWYHGYAFAGGGGGLGWRNAMPVTPGNSYQVVVGAGGTGSTNYASNGNATNGGDSLFFVSIGQGITLDARGRGGGKASSGGSRGGGYIGTGGGRGGGGSWLSGFPTSGRPAGGGGAGGYENRGGTNQNSGGWGTQSSSATEENLTGFAGSGYGGAGGGGGGGYYGEQAVGYYGGGGGGTGLYGEGENGAGGQNFSYYAYKGNGQAGGGGSGGSSGDGINGGYYGGGGGGFSLDRRYGTAVGGQGGSGAVRIIWGAGRSFPFNAS